MKNLKKRRLKVSGLADPAYERLSRRPNPSVDATRMKGRRTTAAALRRQIDEMLLSRLPEGWSHQVMPASVAAGESGGPPKPDILVISPSGRCHFFFTKAPEDRWWDGDIRRVSAESVTAEEHALIGRLKRAGHAVRTVWHRREVLRHLANWGCRLCPDPASAPCGRNRSGAAGRAKPIRPKLTLNLRGE